MSTAERPRLRPLESFPVKQEDGEVVIALRDPEGFAGAIVISHPAALLASLMDGSRTIEELQTDFRARFGQNASLEDIEGLVRSFDERRLLDTDGFRAAWKRQTEQYLKSPVH